MIRRLFAWSEDSWFNLALTIVCIAGVAVAVYLLATGQ